MILAPIVFLTSLSIWIVYMPSFYTTPLLFSLASAYVFFKSWRAPLRSIRFFDDRIEMSGRNLDLRIGYDRIASFTKVKTALGWTNSAVIFTIKDVPGDFRIPNKRNRKLRLDVNALLMSKCLSNPPLEVRERS